jgi:lipoprotein-anchoring transpeptidase ErfK/SrfK
MRNRNPLNVSWRLHMSKRVTLLATAAVLVGLSSGARAENFFQALFGGGWAGGQAVQEGRSVAVATASPYDQNVVRREIGPTRTVVADPTGERPGTITVDTKNRYLYLTMSNGSAVRYDVGVGREGFQWQGNAHIGRKAEWPGWTPPAQMLKRRPDLPRHMKGGIDNPLGARAMYLYGSKGDLMYRIHGSNEPDTIGQAVSSGCIRMLNDDVVDLYNRVGVGTRVKVLL